LDIDCSFWQRHICPFVCELVTGAKFVSTEKFIKNQSSQMAWSVAYVAIAAYCL
jgi:hypothetical protein